MDVSIIICTRNRANFLRKTLRAIAMLDIPQGLACELLVVDNASTDDTKQVACDFAPAHFTMRYVHEPRRGKGYAYNAALAQARGEILLWTDDDVRVPVNWIEGMCAPIRENRADAVAGAVHLAPHLQKLWMTLFHKSILASSERLDREQPAELIGANMAFSRRVLARVPAFDVELGPGALGFGDETLFSWQLVKAGYRIISAFDVAVEHHFEESRLGRAALLDVAQRMGRSHAYTAYHWKHESPPDVPAEQVDEQVDIARRIWRPIYWTGRRAWEWFHQPPYPSEHELHAAQRKGFAEQFRIESKRPRNYEKHGLVKLEHHLQNTN